MSAIFILFSQLTTKENTKKLCNGNYKFGWEKKGKEKQEIKKKGISTGRDEEIEAEKEKRKGREKPG